MMSSTDYKKVYSEVDTFIELLTDENKQKIPKELVAFFKKEKDFDYKIEIDTRKPIKEQNLSSEALSIIAYLNLTYWCEDEEEKKQLINIYNQNEIKHRQGTSINYDSKSSISGEVSNQEEREFFEACKEYFKKFYDI